MPREFTAELSSTACAGAFLQAELEAKREAISRELCTIPPPIPACDVNFNRLLEERARVIDELQRLRRLLASDGDADSVLRFSRASSCVGEAAKRRVEETLRAPTR